MLGISSNTLCLNWFNYALKFSMIQLRSIRSSPLICELRSIWRKQGLLPLPFLPCWSWIELDPLSIYFKIAHFRIIRANHDQLILLAEAK